MTDTYQGSANHETWAFNLHWQNDEALYRTTLAHAAGCSVESLTDSALGELVVKFWQEHIGAYAEASEPVPEALRLWNQEVGSWWRLDYAEVGEAVREALDIEA